MNVEQAGGMFCVWLLEQTQCGSTGESKGNLVDVLSVFHTSGTRIALPCEVGRVSAEHFCRY